MPAPVQFRKYTDLLTRAQINSLSEAARRLYSVIFNKMEFWGSESVSVIDVAAIQGSKMQPSELGSAQEELRLLGLLKIEVLNSRSARYEFIADTQTD